MAQQLMLNELGIGHVVIDARIDEVPPNKRVERAWLRRVAKTQNGTNTATAQDPQGRRRAQNRAKLRDEDVRRTESTRVAQQAKARVAYVPCGAQLMG